MDEDQGLLVGWHEALEFLEPVNRQVDPLSSWLAVDVRDSFDTDVSILDNEVFIVGDAANDPRFADNPLVTGEPKIRFYAGCPIRGPMGHRIGTLCVIDPEPRGMSVEEQATLRDLAAMVEDEVALLATSTVDDLTQVSNRRGFNTVAKHMLALCRRVGTPAEVVFFDLDDFKQTNDILGHKAGDKLLKHFAMLLTKCFRAADVVARLGGDEFAVFMAGSEISSDAALDRLRKVAEDSRNQIQGRLSWSVGRVAFDPDRHTTIESLVADADRVMYEDKISKRIGGT